MRERKHKVKPIKKLFLSLRGSFQLARWGIGAQAEYDGFAEGTKQKLEFRAAKWVGICRTKDQRGRSCAKKGKLPSNHF